MSICGSQTLLFICNVSLFHRILCMHTGLTLFFISVNAFSTWVPLVPNGGPCEASVYSSDRSTCDGKLLWTQTGKPFVRPSFIHIGIHNQGPTYGPHLVYAKVGNHLKGVDLGTTKKFFCQQDQIGIFLQKSFSFGHSFTC